MGGVSWSELAVIAIVALVVLGPKDMTRMFRMMGELTGKARGMAREFQKAMNDAAGEAGVRDVARTLRETASGKTLRDAVGLDGIARDLKAAASFDLGDTSGPLSADEATAQRNAAMGATEAERLKRAERAEAARIRAAEIRARREALAAEREAPEAPAVSPEASAADAAPAPAPDAKSG